VIKQGDRIAFQKGWKLPRPQPAKPKAPKGAKARAVGRRRASTAEQPSLFEA